MHAYLIVLVCLKLERKIVIFLMAYFFVQRKPYLKFEILSLRVAKENFFSS